MEKCICGNNRTFKACCKPFLLEKKKARTVKQLMRSRYSAYALGNHGRYLMNTWHPETIGNVSLTELSLPTCEWKSLEILGYSQQGDTGRVEFRAMYSNAVGSEQIHHEKSSFHRVKGVWLYWDGKML